MSSFNGNSESMYKQNWDRPTFPDQDAASERSMSSGLTSAVGSSSILIECEADYLVSFVAGPRQPAPSVDEGLTRLKQMDATSGLWTMRCTLAVNTKELIVIHRQTMEEMEKFPLSVMQQVTPRESRDPKESFNNLFIFTVSEDKSPPEMHIFQILMSPAATLVDEIRRIKEGKVHPSLPQGNGRTSSDEASGQQLQRASLQSVPAADTVSDSSELDRAQREVYLLNRCFDDIERFVGRIHLAVEASRELQRRQHQRKKKDKKLGDGLLQARARPPPIEDFVDCFKKFKLSLNILARLQDYIHDPNSAELVHFLFTPLVLVCDCSRDSQAGPSNLLGSRVVAPLLSGEAVALLRHCLTSKESELWRRLGDAWTVPRHKWTDYVPPYVPRFADDYQPNPSDYDEAIGITAGDVSNGSSVSAISQAVAEQANYQRMKEEAEKARLEGEKSVLSFPRKSDEGFGAMAVPRPGSSGSGGPQGAVPSPPAGVAPPTYPKVNCFRSYVATHVDRNIRAQSGSDSLDGAVNIPTWAQRQDLFVASVMASGGRLYRTICDKTGKNNKELTVQKGETLEVLDDSRNWWKMRNADGETGHIPYTLLKAVDLHEDSRSPEPVNGDSTAANRQQWQPSIPSPPPPPPPPAMAPAMDPYSPANITRRKDDKKDENKWRSHPGWHRQHSLDLPEHAEELTNELKQKISLGAVQPRVIKRPKSVNINQESPPNVVTEWLKVKGFTERTVSILSGKNGAGLFRMKRYEMDQVLTREESSRLDSLLTVQKNICGYGTRSSLELRAILRKRKEHADSYIDTENPDQKFSDEVF